MTSFRCTELFLSVEEHGAFQQISAVTHGQECPDNCFPLSTQVCHALNDLPAQWIHVSVGMGLDTDDYILGPIPGVEIKNDFPYCTQIISFLPICHQMRKLN